MEIFLTAGNSPVKRSSRMSSTTKNPNLKTNGKAKSPAVRKSKSVNRLQTKFNSASTNR
jgi:hypothetical protein